MLLGGVGYRNLRDESAGPWLADLLGARASDGIEVEDLSYGPVAVSHNFHERPPYDRLVLVGAVRRGRPPGTIEEYRWQGLLPAPDEIQERVAEAVTGVVSLDNLLVVVQAFGGMPEDVRVLEIEPGPEGWGEEFSGEVEARLPELVERAWALALDADASSSAPGGAPDAPP